MIRTVIYKAFSWLGSFEAAALEKDTREPAAAQLRKLKEIVQRNANTAYGREHNFANINSVQDYRNSVRINDYEDLRPYIERIMSGEKKILTDDQPFMFATTSGTMGKQKYIPVTESYIKEFRHASVASGLYMLRNYPDINQGVTLSLFSPAVEGETSSGIPYGAISGALYLREPGLVKKWISPIPYPVYQIKDYESRYYTLLRIALVLPVTCFYTLNPSTIVVLLKRLKSNAKNLIKDVAEGTITPPQALLPECLNSIAQYLRPNPQRAAFLEQLLAQEEFVPYKIWPKLQVVCCWTKAAAAFYLNDFPEFFGPTPICDITYGASEGRGTVSMGDGRQLLSIRSHFYEFIPEAEIDKKDPTVLLAHELVEGQNYYILFSSSAGLYRYHINDVVKVSGFYNKTPLIEFQYKGGNVSSFTGEKLTELHVTEAMSKLTTALGLSCRFFTVLPEFRPNPHYRLLLEFENVDFYCSPEGKLQLQKIADIYERALCELNMEYLAKRESQRLDPVVVELLPQGSYERLRKQLVQQGVADAQIKLSHLNPKAETRKYFEKEVLEQRV